MGFTNGPPTGWQHNMPLRGNDSEPYSFSEFPTYHWGYVFASNRNRKPIIHFNRKTMPLLLAHEAEMIIRYDLDTWEPVVVKCRYHLTPCSLEAAIEAKEKYGALDLGSLTTIPGGKNR